MRPSFRTDSGWLCRFRKQPAPSERASDWRASLESVLLVWPRSLELNEISGGIGSPMFSSQ